MPHCQCLQRTKWTKPTKRTLTKRTDKLGKLGTWYTVPENHNRITPKVVWCYLECGNKCIRLPLFH